MRDDRNKWPVALGQDRTNLVGRGVKVRMVALTRQTVISGAVADCLALCGAKVATGGGTDIASGDVYTLRQRRDRLLVVNGPAIEDGWHPEARVAVCDMSAAYAVISMSGSNVEQVISTGTEFASGEASPSVSRLWHGFGILLYRHGAADSYRMHVRAAHLEAVWEMLDRQISALVGVWTTEPPYDVVLGGNDNAKPKCQKAS